MTFFRAVLLSSLIGLLLGHVASRRKRLSSDSLSAECISKVKDRDFQLDSFRLAREEIMWNSTVYQSKDLFEQFFSPPWGADLYCINNISIAYVIIFKCDSEGISKSLLAQDQYHLAHPEEKTGFDARRSESPGKLESAAHRCYNNRTVAKFTFIRDPLSHFVSGIVESHFRGVVHKPRDVNSSAVQALLAKRSVDVSGVKDILGAIFSFDQKQIIRTMQQVMHYGIQSSIIKQYQVQFVGRLENFDADWHQLNKFLGTNLTLLFDSHHITSSDPLNFKRSLARLFSEDIRYLRAVCRIILIDYICLGYELPPECADMLPLRS